MFSLFLFILAVTAASSSTSKASTLSEHVNAVSSTFTTFEKPEDLYKLIYTSYKTGVLSLDGSYSKVLLLDMVKSIPVLKDFCETNEILVGDDLRSDALLTYLNTNFELRNLLVREGVINAAGEYQQAAVHSIIERYNPASGKLDPVSVSKTGKSNIITSETIQKIKLDTVSDVQQVVLKLYQYGLFDQEGNFIETALKALLHKEPNLAKMLFKEHIVDENFDINPVRTQQYIEKRPDLLSLLEQANLYVDQKLNTAAVKQIIFSYNKETKQLDKQSDQPVISQNKPDSETETAIDAENLRSQLLQDAETTPQIQINHLLNDPEKYLRDVIAYGRRNSVFDANGYFDYYAFYKLLATNESLLSNAISLGIFDNNRNFYPAKLLDFVNKNSKLKKACQNIGILTAEQKYSKDAVYAITKAYGSKYETAKKEFTLDDPESISSRDELSLFLKTAVENKILDSTGKIDYPALYSYLEKTPILKSNVENNVLLKSMDYHYSAVREMILRRPLLRKTLIETNILDDIGAFNAKAFQNQIVDAINNKFATSTQNSTSIDQKTKLTEEDVEKLETVIYDISGIYRIAEDKDDNISIKKNDKNDKLKENETVLSDSSEVKVFVLTPEEKKAISNSKKEEKVTSTTINRIRKKKSSSNISMPILITACICVSVLAIFFVAIFFISKKNEKKISDKYHEF